MSNETLDKENLLKLEVLRNPRALGIVNEYIALCVPSSVRVLTDSPEDKAYARKRSLELGEEEELAMAGHTVHFDGPHDQGRDKVKTKILVSGGVHMSAHVNVGEREECLAEVQEFLRGSMKGREMLVAFYCLGPLHSPFSILAMQITDSAYVIHSANLLYRSGYESFKTLGGNGHFFHFIHSAGELQEGVSKHSDKKRIYIDIESNRVFAVNVQYAGNSMGLKKLALRLAIRKAVNEGWLCEHMFIMDARPTGKNRSTYFTGAFPSASGKTSTAMIPGQKIVGDDIAYIRAGEDGRAYAANSEQGIFGILEDVNPIDDALIYKTLTEPRQDLRTHFKTFRNVNRAQAI
jgi:phosphoenolpyruvate carboxykinase (GTP)